MIVSFHLVRVIRLTLIDPTEKISQTIFLKLSKPFLMTKNSKLSTFRYIESEKSSKLVVSKIEIHEIQ